MDDGDPLAGEATPFLQSRGNSRNRSLLTIFDADQPRSRLVGIEDGALMQIMPQVNAKMVRLAMQRWTVRSVKGPKGSVSKGVVSISLAINQPSSEKASIGECKNFGPWQSSIERASSQQGRPSQHLAAIRVLLSNDH